MESWTIGQLARAAGVHVETIRYYQRMGLLPMPPRPPGGVRRYPTELVHRIRFIKRAQALGFTLKDIAELLALGEGRCEDVRQRAEARLQGIEARIRDLESMREALEGFIRRCQAGEPSAPCPLIERLSS